MEIVKAGLLSPGVTPSNIRVHTSSILRKTLGAFCGDDDRSLTLTECLLWARHVLRPLRTLNSPQDSHAIVMPVAQTRRPRHREVK